MGELEALRSRIRRIDKDILHLVATRLEHAAEVGKIKKSQGVPLRDWEVERTVLDHAEQTAAQIGLSRPLARSLMQLLIAESRAEQERQTYSSYSGSAESILIIGGHGKMGRWFGEFFGNQGHRVSVYDAGTASNASAWPAALKESLAGTSFALIATPIETVPEVLDELTAARYAGIVFDIASLKGHLTPAVARAAAAGLALTSIHPMFGPDARTLSDHVICFCDCGQAEATRRVRGFFADTAATLVDLSFDEHDHIVACVLGLSHLVNIVFTSALVHSGVSFETLSRVGSTTFQAQMSTTATVIQESPELYYGIQRFNSFTPQLYELLKRDLETLMSAVLDGDPRPFVEIMQAGRHWVAGQDAP